MAYVAQSHVAIGDTWSAASHNQLLDNIAYLYAAIGSGGLPAGGAAYQGVRVNSAASAKEWAAVMSVLRRQGGNANDWITQGTTAYTPDKAIVQAGALTISMSGNPMTGSGSVTFPVAFAYKPLVFVTSDVMTSGGVFMQFGHTNVSTSGFDVWCSYNANSTYGNRTVSWLAMGTP